MSVCEKKFLAKCGFAVIKLSEGFEQAEREGNFVFGIRICESRCSEHIAFSQLRLEIYPMPETPSLQLQNLPSVHGYPVKDECQNRLQCISLANIV